jgi:hypothetical protein
MKLRDNGRAQDANNEENNLALSHDLQDKNSSVFKNMISKEKFKGWYGRFGRKNTTIRDNESQNPALNLIDQPSNTSSKTSEFRRIFRLKGRNNTSQAAAELAEFKSD